MSEHMPMDTSPDTVTGKLALNNEAVTQHSAFNDGRNIPSATPYDSTQPDTYTKEDLKWKQHFTNEDQWRYFTQLPLSEAQRVAFMTKLQQDHAQKVSSK